MRFEQCLVLTLRIKENDLIIISTMLEDFENEKNHVIIINVVVIGKFFFQNANR